MIPLNYILNTWAMGRTQDILGSYGLNAWQASSLPALLTAFERSEQRPFRPHVTLARIRERGGRIARKHPIDRDLVLSQRITSVELMRSPPPGAISYTVLASVPLGTAGLSHNPS
jgi:2'-5' RNA ligase